MYNPCFDCFNRHGRSYAEEYCDNTCLYANNVKNMNAIIYFLLDMLEEEHMGMRAIAVKEIENLFGIEV